MTGIESLRELANGVNCSVWACTDMHYCTDHDLSKDNNGGRMRDVLNDIADQIEREHAEDCFRMGERAADVSMSAYDLLPPDERKAIAWVREHGGLDAVKRRWKGYVPAAWLEEAKSRHEQRCDRLKAHAWELERKCAERRETIEELGKTIDDMRPRLMPEGMEWPRFEDGEPVKFGDVVNGVTVRSMVFREDGILLSDCTSVPGWGTWRSYAEPIKRPAPKVLDADGAEIRVGDELYGPRSGNGPFVVEAISEQGELRLRAEPSDCRILGAPDAFTHRAPVLAADGRPLREGDMVWHVLGEFGPRVVSKFETHDGRPVAVFEPNGTDLRGSECDQLTHERPDSWERLEEDAKKPTCEYFGHSADDGSCETCSAYTDSTPQGGRGCRYGQMADLVRRAKALAERDA